MKREGAEAKVFFFLLREVEVVPSARYGKGSWWVEIRK